MRKTIIMVPPNPLPKMELQDQLRHIIEALDFYHHYSTNDPDIRCDLDAYKAELWDKYYRIVNELKKVDI